MSPSPRFHLADAGPAPEIRWVERASELTETLARPDWTTARVEAWLDWADTLPEDWPANAPESLAAGGAEPVLAGGPDRLARRLAAWGLALGLLESEAAALAFRQALLAACAGGVIAPGPQLRFGARVHPIAGDTALPAKAAPPALGSRAFSAAAAELRAEFGLAARLPAGPLARLASVADAVSRCAGDPAGCADPAAN